MNDKPLPFQQGTWRKDHDIGIDSVNSLFDCIYGKGPCYLPIQKKTCAIIYLILIARYLIWVNIYRYILVGWTSIYQLFWGSLGTRVLTHPHMIDDMISIVSFIKNIDLWLHRCGAGAEELMVSPLSFWCRFLGPGRDSGMGCWDPGDEMLGKSPFL